MAKLYFYYSAMNAGKTTTLLQSNHNYQERGMGTLMFIPVIDNRYETGKITSRIGLSADATTFGDSFDFFTFIHEKILDKKRNIHCVLVDEAHFLQKYHVEQLARVADCLNVPVLAYGLRTDFQGEPFVGSQYLLSWAEELIEIKTTCHCGKKATMNVRIDAMGKKVLEGDQIDIGGNDRYTSTCRKHFTSRDAGQRVASKCCP